MACKNCNNTDNKCGCKDTPLVTMPTYTCPPDTVCPDPTPCFETIQDTCVKHSLNYQIYNFGSFAGTTGYNLPAGASLENAYQALSLTSLDANCTPVIGLHPSYVGTTALVINWESCVGAQSYTLSYGTTSSLGTNITGLITTSYTLTNLVPFTSYYFKVTTNCDGASSESAIIIVTTH